ncbi:NADH-quinone oxidoreductase subunit K [Mangrovivirga cuniculi]|uniref:Cation:proton antiporter n=1 Tax=Mangrovivirga cuniculi TaxID=2715131 RepID=A0A4D7K725_9BACT|nr:NADH-quinone oxidoreductase subunit K [Mangrovivirga cuniculi]QCK16524.1 cation:proton antiporter [Mangrovivirga cuniculi]
MNLIISLIVGILFTASVYLMFQKSFFKLIIGVILFGYATIFFLFTVGGITKDSPPILSAQQASEGIADPLPQALTLTAIVISIGVQIFVIVLLKKVYQNLGTEDLDELNTTDKID